MDQPNLPVAFISINKRKATVKFGRSTVYFYASRLSPIKKHKIEILTIAFVFSAIYGVDQYLHEYSKLMNLENQQPAIIDWDLQKSLEWLECKNCKKLLKLPKYVNFLGAYS